MSSQVDLAPTPKGRREAARIIAAATTVLARDGYASATMRGVAAEAGVDKRMVIYYFKTREHLMANVVREVGRSVSERVEAAMSGLSAPDQVAGTGIEALWAASTEVPAMPRAYLTLVTASDSEEVLAALADMKRELRAMFMRRIEALEALGYELLGDREAYVTLMLAIVRGLIMEWSEEGDSPELSESLEQFKAIAMSRFVLSPE